MQAPSLGQKLNTSRPECSSHGLLHHDPWFFSKPIATELVCISKRRLLSHKPPAPVLTNALAMSARRARDGSGCNKQPDGSAGDLKGGGAGGDDGAGVGDGFTVATNDNPMEAHCDDDDVAPPLTVGPRVSAKELRDQLANAFEWLTLLGQARCVRCHDAWGAPLWVLRPRPRYHCRVYGGVGLHRSLREMARPLTPHSRIIRAHRSNARSPRTATLLLEPEPTAHTAPPRSRPPRALPRELPRRRRAIDAHQPIGASAHAHAVRRRRSDSSTPLSAVHRTASLVTSLRYA